MLNIFVNNFNNMSGLKPVEETNDPLFKLLNNLRNTPQFDLNQAVDKELKEIITKKIEEMNTTTPEYQKLLNLSLNNPEKYL